MPYEVRKDKDKFCVFNTDTDESKGCSDTKAQAAAHLKALYSAEAEMAAEEVLADLEENEETLSGDNYVFSEGMKEYPWEGPIVFENVTTGDNRVFKSDSINWQEDTLPWAFRWQKASGQGHAGSVPVGRVDRIARMEDGSIHGYGVVIPDLSDEAAQYLKLLESGVGGGVSVDGDSAQFEIQEQENGSQPRVEFSSMRLRALSAVDIPAFNGARIRLLGSDPASTTTEELEVQHDDDEVDITEDDTPKKVVSYGWQVEDAIVASSIPILPSTMAFLDPEFDGPTALTVTPDGRVFGHLALFNTCHIGFPGTCVKPPKGSTYQYFHTGQIETSEGDIVDVGRLTFKTGHAEMSATPRIAAEHYDNTGAVAADVRAGEDKFGIWVVGALRPHLSDEDIRAFRAAPLSGDWRRIAGRLELVGALGVNTPGFPVPRVKALVASGETETLFTFPEGNEEELFTDYELNLRNNKKVALASKVGKYYSDYELDLRHNKKVALATSIEQDLDDKDVPEGKIEEEVPPAPTKKELEAKVQNYSKEQLFADLQQIKELLDDSDVTMPKKVRDGLGELYKAFTIIGKDSKNFSVEGFDLDIVTASGLAPDEWQAQLEMSGLDVIEFYNICHDKDGKFCEGKDGPGRSRDKVVSGRHYVDKAKPGTSAHGSDIPGESPEAHAHKDKAAGGHGYKHISPGGSGGPSGPSGPSGSGGHGGGHSGPSGPGGGGGGGGGGVNTRTYENFRIARTNALRWGAAATVALAAVNSPLSGIMQGIASSVGLGLIGSPAILGLIFVTGTAYAVKNTLAARRHRTEFNHQVDKKLRVDKANQAADRIRSRALHGP